MISCSNISQTYSFSSMPCDLKVLHIVYQYASGLVETHAHSNSYNVGSKEGKVTLCYEYIGNHETKVTVNFIQFNSNSCISRRSSSSCALLIEPHIFILCVLVRCLNGYTEAKTSWYIPFGSERDVTREPLCTFLHTAEWRRSTEIIVPCR